ncbi:hypothetical protein FRC11_012923, partial [Ceratobasidium sp. 423]
GPGCEEAGAYIRWVINLGVAKLFIMIMSNRSEHWSGRWISNEEQASLAPGSSTRRDQVSLVQTSNASTQSLPES